MPRRHARGSVPLLAALAAGLGGGYLIRPYVAPNPSASPADFGLPPAEAPAAISALARLQPLGGVIPVYGPPGDRIDTLAQIDPGHTLKPGDTIATLASRTERAKEVRIARIQLREAEESKRLAEASGRKKIAVAEVEVGQIAADEEFDKTALAAQAAVLDQNQRFAAAQVGRMAKLVQSGVRVAAEEREQADLLLAKAKAEAVAARAKQDKATAGYARAKALAEAKLAAAEAELAEALARVPIESAAEKYRLAEHLLGLTEVKAPVEGRVLKVVAHAGEPTGGQQPILYLADTRAMVAVAEVYESDVAKLRAGLAHGKSFTAKVSSPALPNDVPLIGTVDSDALINRMIARNAIFAVSPREDSDRRVVEVTVRLDARTAAVVAPYVGLQVGVELTPGQEP